MNSINLSKRLQKVADFIIAYGDNPISLADIGTDHAYLPVNLKLNNHILTAIAGDVVEGPYQSALKEVAENNLEDDIAVRLGNGLNVIDNPEETNVISICGMGGRLITTILEEGYSKINRKTLLVLQANNSANAIRKWLTDNNYNIIDETIIKEGRHYYDIIVARQSEKNVHLSIKELYLGPINIQNRSNDAINKWQHDLNNLLKIKNNITNDTQKNRTKIIELNNQIKFIEEVLLNE